MKTAVFFFMQSLWKLLLPESQDTNLQIMSTVEGVNRQVGQIVSGCPPQPGEASKSRARIKTSSSICWLSRPV